MSPHLQTFQCGEPAGPDIQDGAVIELAAIDGFLLEAPVWEMHHKGINYLAVIGVDASSPGGLARRFIPKGRGECLYIIAQVEPLDALEFGAQWTTCVGRKKANRWHGVVLAKTDTRLVVEQCKSGVRAILRAREKRDA